MKRTTSVGNLVPSQGGRRVAAAACVRREAAQREGSLVHICSVGGVSWEWHMMQNTSKN